MRPLLAAAWLLAALAAPAAQAQASRAPKPASPSRPAPAPGTAAATPSAPAPAAPAPAAAPAPTSTPAPQAPADTSASADVALLRGLLAATEPAPEEIRTIAIEDLGLLGDPRALDPLASFIWDPNPRIQQAALRAVALFQHPRAAEILGNVVRHPRLPEALKIQAISGLIFQRTPTARRTVQDTAADSRMGWTVQNAARTVLAQWDAAPPTPAK